MMNNSITEHVNFPTIDGSYKPRAGQKIILHYIMDGRVLCETECHLTAATKFIELPLPVLHRMAMK